LPLHVCQLACIRTAAASCTFVCRIAFLLLLLLLLLLF
jgi:hypothetical protein